MPPAPNSQALAGQLAAYDAKPVTSTDALNSALTQYGVPEIRQTVSGLRTTLANTQNAYNAVDPSVTGRTQGSLVTEAQRSKQVANERAPIAGQINDQSKALGQNEQDLTDALGQANTTAQNQVNDYNTGRSALQSEYQNAATSEKDAAAQQLAQQQLAETTREANISAANKAASVNPAQGYSVKSLSSGNKAYTSPNGETNLYQYASAVAGGDPTNTYNQILSQLKSGSTTDKAAYNKVAKLSMADGISYLQKNNSYIFD